MTAGEAERNQRPEVDPLLLEFEESTAIAAKIPFTSPVRMDWTPL